MEGGGVKEGPQKYRSNLKVHLITSPENVELLTYGEFERLTGWELLISWSILVSWIVPDGFVESMSRFHGGRRNIKTSSPDLNLYIYSKLVLYSNIYILFNTACSYFNFNVFYNRRPIIP